MELVLALLLLLMVPGLLTFLPSRSTGELTQREYDHFLNCRSTALPQDDLDGDRNGQAER